MTTLTVNLTVYSVDLEYLQSLATNYECQLDSSQYPNQVIYTGMENVYTIKNRLIEQISATHNIDNQSMIESQFETV